jgi:hypothetical protein
LLALLPLIPLPYQTAPVPQVPAGWQGTFTALRLPPGAPVLVLPFPSAQQPAGLRWQADTGSPGSMIGGYFLGPGATGQAAYYFTQRTPETIVASYLNELWQGQHPPSPPGNELHAVFGYWRPAAIVVVAGQRSPVIRVLTQLFGKPALHVGQVVSWRQPRSP